MKRIIITALALCLVFGLATAQAGQKTMGKRTEKTEEMSKPQFIDKYPPMVFHSGVLNQAGMGNWRVGEMDLWLKKDCVIMSDGEEGGSLRDGRQAIIMGSRTGNTIVAWSVRVMKPDTGEKPVPNREFWIEKGPNPNVGIIHGKVD